MSSNQRHIKNYLLDKHYQLRYTLYTVLLSAFLTCGLGFIWYKQMRTTSQVIEVKALATLNEETATQVQEDLKDQDRQRLLVLVGFGIMLTLILSGTGIVLTHKVAGPLFKISHYMNELQEGRFMKLYDLRKGDQIHSFYDTFKQMYEAILVRTQAELEEIKKIEERMVAMGEGKPDLMQEPTYKNALELIRHVRALKERSLEKVTTTEVV